MLGKINRLSKKKDFEEVFKGGKGFKGGFLIFKSLKNNLGGSRFGFVVSKKVSNKAVLRNKIKRRLRAAVLNIIDKKNGKPSYNSHFDLIIIALPDIKKKDFAEIQDAITQFFIKFKINV